MRLLPVLLLAGVLVGCSKKADTDVRPSAEGEISIPAALVGGAPVVLDPDEILISVNDSALTRGEAMRQVQLRLGGPPPPDMPGERVELIQRQVLSKVIDEFVKRELLLREADRLGIGAPAEQIEEALAAIRQRTPEGQEPKGILADGPAGQDSLRNEVITGIRIEKLLATVLPPAAEPTEAEIAAFREDRHLESVPADDEQIVAILKQRARAQALADYVRGLQRNANIKHSAAVRPPMPVTPPQENE